METGLGSCCLLMTRSISFIQLKRFFSPKLKITWIRNGVECKTGSRACEGIDDWKNSFCQMQTLTQGVGLNLDWKTGGEAERGLSGEKCTVREVDKVK